MATKKTSKKGTLATIYDKAKGAMTDVLSGAASGAAVPAEAENASSKAAWSGRSVGTRIP